MPVIAADGILGIEARHKWINLTTSTVLATLGNNELWPTVDLVGDVPTRIWPHYKIKDIVGLFDFPDIEDNSEPKTEAVGTIPYPSRARSKNVTYTVEVRGRTLQEMRAGGAALRAAFGPDITTGLVVERLMIVTPHPTYGTQEHAYTARCLQFSQGTDAQTKGAGATPTAFVRTDVIGLRLYDPRIFEWDPLAEIGLENPKW